MSLEAASDMSIDANATDIHSTPPGDDNHADQDSASDDFSVTDTHAVSHDQLGTGPAQAAHIVSPDTDTDTDTTHPVGHSGKAQAPKGTASHGVPGQSVPCQGLTPAQIAKKIMKSRSRKANKQHVVERRQRAALGAFAGEPAMEYSLDPPWVKKKKAKAEQRAKAALFADIKGAKGYSANVCC